MREYIRKTFTFEGKRYTVRGKTEKEAFMKMANKIRDLEEGTVVISGNTLVDVEEFFGTGLVLRPDGKICRSSEKTKSLRIS